MIETEAVRVRQGASETTAPEVLRALATDPSVTVRVSLAMNPALPEDAAAILAADTDARVRTILSRKLATLTPSLTGEARQQIQKDAVASLTAMVADAALRIRTNIAEVVRDMPDGPREIVLRLAHDPAVMVCEPVIRFSPMLTQEDLITLIASGPPPSTMLAVATRPRIGNAVSDAIVSSADSVAIGALLANHTAHIREATLDALAAQSEEHTGWQEPLVNRPHLPIRAQRMLAEIVTGHLLDRLTARSDLDPKVTRTLRASLASHVAPQPKLDAGKQSALDSARASKQAGTLDDYAILDALRKSNPAAAMAMLAVKADVTLAVVERACGLRSAKAVVSLCWKGGLTAQTAVVLQGMLANLPPDQILRPGDGGGYPLSEDEMRWQHTFLGAGDPAPRPWRP